MLPEGLPEKTLGFQVLQWCSEWLVNPDSRGGLKGERWVFRPDQARFILWFYAVDDNGDWIYRRAYRERAKGTGKSPMVAAIACAEFLGPVMFSHFDDAGNPVGKEREDALIWLTAISRDGCRHTYNYVMGMLEGPCQAEYNISIGATRILIEGMNRNKVIESITASYRSHEGPQPTFVIAEETQNWVPSEGGINLYELLSRGLTKTDGRLIEVTNAPVPGEGSVAEETKKTWAEIESGDKDDAEGLLYDTYGIRVENIYDEEQAMPALEKIYEHAPWINLKRVYRDIKDRQWREVNARRFFFNETVPPVSMWLSNSEWQEAFRDTKLKRGDQLSIGFRFRRNCAAIVAVRLKDAAIFVLKSWERKMDAPQEWEAPYLAIDDKMRSTFEKYDVYNVVASPENFQELVGRWSVDYENSVIVKELWTSKNRQKWADAIEMFETAITTKRLTHDGDPDLARHIQNCFVDEVAQGNLIRQETSYSHRYIVIAEAAVLAMRAAADAIEDGALRERSSGILYSF